jgi:hypothetical protein
MIAVVAAAGFALLAGPAFAQSRSLVPADAVDPAGIRVVTANMVSSDCIGRPRTPLCGIEMVIDCVHYIRSSRCDGYEWNDILAEPKPVRVEYAVGKSGFVNPVQASHVLRYDFIDEFLYFVFPDSYQARIFLRVCPEARLSCAGIGWHDFLFTVNRRDGEWTGRAIKTNYFDAYDLVD